jgi:hypothetical protein
MPIERSEIRRLITIDKNDMYKQINDRRNLEQITISSANEFRPVSEEFKDSLSYYEHEWRRGDKFYKLAFEYYGDVNYWWIIPLFNNKPTEFHFKAGDVVLVPIEIELLISEYGL